MMTTLALSSTQQLARRNGFYAKIPRILRVHYRELSHAAKWLYVCLKDLCGDAGTCYRSLRSLAGETGISIASLCGMIPALHNAGLIHAEKKRRDGDLGHEVWHISIVDIWGLNRQYCSTFEQSVQNLNNDSPDRSDNEHHRSEFEQSRSNFRTKEETGRTTKNYQDSKKESMLASLPLLSSSVDYGSLRSSPWTQETILALSSAILAIPDFRAVEETGDQVAIETMYREWIHPAQWIYDRHKDVDPRLAWERIERHLRGMTEPDSPSWWASGRARKSPITLRHVVGANGKNWDAVQAELDHHQWYPSQLTPYDGPPLVEEPSYAQGYGGVRDEQPVTITEIRDVPEKSSPPPRTDAAERVEEIADGTGIEAFVGPITEEVAAIPTPAPQPRPRGMSARVAEDLAARMLHAYPQLDIPGFAQVEPDRWAIVVNVSPEQCIEISSRRQWYEPSEQLAALIDEALIYGAQCSAMIRNESSEVDAVVAQQSLEGG